MLFAALSSFPAWGQTGYGALAATFWEYEEDGVPSLEATAARVSGGFFLNENFALEAQFATGGEDSLTVNAGGTLVPVEAELERIVSVFARLNAPVHERINLFGLLGYSDVKFEVSATGPGGTASVSDSESGFSYGAGAEFGISERLYLSADYISYLDSSNYSFEAVSVGLRMNFE